MVRIERVRTVFWIIASVIVAVALAMWVKSSIEIASGIRVFIGPPVGRPLTVVRRVSNGKSLVSICNGSTRNVRSLSIMLPDDLLIVGSLAPEDCADFFNPETDLRGAFTIKVDGQLEDSGRISGSLGWSGGAVNGIRLRITPGGKVYAY